MSLALIAFLWRRHYRRLEIPGEVPADAPFANESIEAYDHRMSGADIPEAPAMKRLDRAKAARAEFGMCGVRT